MVHSIELLFDPDTEAAIRTIWADLAAADIPSRVPAGRPHVTLAVAERIAPDVDPLLRPVTRQLPLACTVGAALLFGLTNAVLARLIVPSAELLALHAEVHRLCGLVYVARPVAEQPARPMDGACDGGPPGRGTATGERFPGGRSAAGDSRHGGRSAALGWHRARRVPDQLSYLPLLPGLLPPPAV